MTARADHPLRLVMPLVRGRGPPTIARAISEVVVDPFDLRSIRPRTDVLKECHKRFAPNLCDPDTATPVQRRIMSPQILYSGVLERRCVRARRAVNSLRKHPHDFDLPLSRSSIRCSLTVRQSHWQQPPALRPRFQRHKPPESFSCQITSLASSHRFPLSPKNEPSVPPILPSVAEPYPRGDNKNRGNCRSPANRLTTLEIGGKCTQFAVAFQFRGFL
jgi:hypothetical protein